VKLRFEPVKRSPIFTSIPAVEWNSWSWQLRQSLKSKAEFEKIFKLAEDEESAFLRAQATNLNPIFNIRSTPYYASLCTDSIDDPLRKILMPSQAEFSMGAQAQLDPLGELKNSPAPRLIHRYPDRVLFLVTDICSVYCRYCTRKHFTGQEQAFIKESEYEQALQYLRSRTGIREVILSGGDPLTLSDQHLQRVLSDLRSIEHIEIIRIGTRMHVVCPMRITSDLVAMIRKFGPVYLMTHFNHPRELTAEAKMALDLFADAGIPLFNQMVLLRGVNNHPAIVQALSRRLLYLRVKPYYMFQCDPSEGTDHLRTSLEESEKIQAELWGNLSGLAMPNFSIDVPSGGGKVGVVPDFEISRSAKGRSYLGFDGVREEYRNPENHELKIPTDLNQYLTEWEELKAAKQIQPSGPLEPRIFSDKFFDGLIGE